jgi:hypothetical protein
MKAATEAFLAAEVSPWTRNEDLYICRDLAESLSCRGMRFAPPEVAAEFSFEQPCDDLPIGPGETFGFHGRMTEATQRHCACLDRQVNDGKLRLIVNYYNDPHYPRAVEIDECLRANCGPGLFDEVLALATRETFLPRFRKIWRQKTGELPLCLDPRPTFAGHFMAAEWHGHKADISVVANADIEFTPAACELLRRVPPGEFWCLSRWEGGDDSGQPWQPPGPGYAHCQDAWAWRGPCKIWDAAFPLGYPACENRLAWLADKAGYRVANPSLSCEIRHVHQSGFRRYPATDVAVKCRDRVPPPYLYIAPHRLGETPKVRVDEMGPALPEKAVIEELSLQA